MVCNKFFIIILIFAALLFSTMVIGLGAWCSYRYISPVERTEQTVTDIADGGRVNALLLTTDEEGGLTDTVTLLSFDPHRERLNILLIPKDIRVLRDGTFYRFDTLYAMEEEGKRHEEPVRYVKELTGLPIHYYAVMHPKALRTVVDELGGVRIDVPKRMYYRDSKRNFTVDLSPGYQLLDGEKAEQFIRFQVNCGDGESERIKARQMLVTELISQKANARYLGRIPRLLQKISPHVQTNMKIADFPLLLKFFGNFSELTVSTFRLPVSTKLKNGISYVICDEEETRQLLRREFLGQE